MKCKYVVLSGGPMHGEAMCWKVSGTMVFTLHGQTGHYNSGGVWVPKA